MSSVVLGDTLAWIAQLGGKLLEQDAAVEARLITEAPIALAAFCGPRHDLVACSPMWRQVFASVKLPAAIEAILDRTYRSDNNMAREVMVAEPDVDGTYRVVASPVCAGREGDIAGVVLAAERIGDSRQTPRSGSSREKLAQRAQVALLERLASAVARAEQAIHAKDHVLAFVTHELRAPLTTIMLWEKVLRDHVHDPELRSRALDAIRESVATQMRVVGDLLDVSRGISGKLFLDRQRVDVAEVLAAAIDGIRPRVAERGLELVVRLRDNSALVSADPARLRQVFDNVLSNAVKFTPSGGTITATCAAGRASVVIEIRDTGRGIPADVLPRVFEPFFQVDDAVMRGDRGLGVGLSIARQLVTLHDGTLTAHSDGVGHGSTFRITLPIAASRQRSPSDATKRRKLQGSTVLVIDDDARVRDALRLLLARHGARILSAGSAVAARVLLDSERPDIVLCDVAMPDEDGFAFMRRLRGSTWHRDLPAIALTGYASDADRNRVSDAGFDAHIAKPVVDAKLAAAIWAVLDAHGRQPTRSGSSK